MTAVVILAWAACLQNWFAGRNLASVPFLALLALLAAGNLRFGIDVLAARPAAPWARWFARSLAVALIVGGALALVEGFRSGMVLLYPFGALTLFFGVQHTRAYFLPPPARPARIAAHLGNVLGSCIAAWTAFLVVTSSGVLPVPPWVVWLAPTVVFTPMIVLWGRAWARPAGRSA